MARIIFIPFPEMGHLYASFKLAKSLKPRGHQIFYLGIQDFEEAVEMQRFEFLPVFEKVIQKGFIHQQVVNGGIETFDAILSAVRNDARAIDPLAELGQVVRRIQPDLLVIDLLLSAVALMAKKARIPSVLLNTQFYDPWEDPRKAADYHLLLDVPELVLCPQEFDFPRSEKRENCFYVESSIDQSRRDVPFPWHRLSADKGIIYCSLGTQGHLIGGARNVLQTVIDAVSTRGDCQLILTTGTHLTPSDFGAVPANIILVDKAPQLDILKRCSLMITHGGFNTVKECIYFGIPMIVFPLIRDHPAVAARLVHYGLGVRGNINKVSVDLINSLIDQIEGDPSFRRRCSQMGERFRELEESESAVRIVTSVIDGLPGQHRA